MFVTVMLGGLCRCDLSHRVGQVLQTECTREEIAEVIEENEETGFTRWYHEREAMDTPGYIVP